MNRKIEFSQLSIEIEETDSQVVYYFSGDVNENFNQADVPLISRNRIVLDLKGVENFNSCGIREWIYFIRSLTGKGSIYFRNCSIATVDQINMIPDSLGGASIESFYAPYFCQEHGESIQLIEVEKNRDDLMHLVAPTFKCSECGKDLEFDALEESYFMFITQGSEEKKVS